MKNDYYVGLDLGSGSVGWAVTDPDYHLLRSHGKALWGVRLFDTAKQQKNDVYFVLHVEDYNAATGD